jgi:anti-sigma B factor antagonist
VRAATGGSLALVISAPRILRIFQITGLTNVLPAQRSVQDAITADPHWQHAAESEAGSVHEWCRQHSLS